MQAVPDEVRKCVVFLYYKDFGGNERLAGTGFFVSVSIEEQFQASYLVTAKHVIQGIENNTSDGTVYMRMNTIDQGVGVGASDVSQWQYHPTDDSVDAAVLACAPDQSVLDYRNIPITMAVTDEVRDNERIGAGDEIFLTGLFHYHYGTKRNLPIIRTGHIALMPEEEVHTDSMGYIDAYLIEARSIGGLSGSPVFVYLGHMRGSSEGVTLRQGSLFYWLGIMHGHWDIDERHIDSQDTNAVGRSVNMGIGIVVPATKVLEILHGEYFAKQREKAVEAYRKRVGTVETAQ